MTVHRAKGLETHCAAVLGLCAVRGARKAVNRKRHQTLGRELRHLARQVSVGSLLASEVFSYSARRVMMSLVVMVVFTWSGRL